MKVAARTDFFETPLWVVRAISPELARIPFLKVVDVGCGTGALLRGLFSTVDNDGWEASGIELVPDRALTARRTLTVPVCVGDALAVDWGSPDLVVMHPDPKDAAAFFLRAVEQVAPGGHILLLTHATFLETQKRASLHREHRFQMVVLSERPSCCNTVKCMDASCDYRDSFPPGGSRPTRCPLCGDALRLIQNDSSMYAWFLYGPRTEPGTFRLHLGK